jgi:hypothetical protein
MTYIPDFLVDDFPNVKLTFAVELHLGFDPMAC